MAQLTVKEQSIDTYDPDDDSQFANKMELIEHIKSVVGTKRHKEKPLNVVVLGCPGSGKSAFLNTVFTSFRTDCWAERAWVGDYGAVGEQQVTTHFLRYTSAENYYPEYPDVLLPTFIDVQGLDDGNCEFNAEFLRGLFNGKIRDGQCLSEIRALYDEKGKDELRRILENQSDQFKVDRIIVVASADPKARLPCNLLQCIHGASRLKRNIPIFGVMTGEDKFGNNQETKEKIVKFRNTLGITEDRFLIMRNYCPDIDTHTPKRYLVSVFPYVDVPVLQFIRQVVSPHLRVIHAKTGFARNKWSVPFENFRMDITEMSPIVLLQISLLLMFVVWLSVPCISFNTLNTLCADYSFIKDQKPELKISGLDSICSDKIEISSFPTKTAILYLMLTFFAIPNLDFIYNFLEENRFDIRKNFVYACAFVTLMLSLLLARF